MMPRPPASLPTFSRPRTHPTADACARVRRVHAGPGRGRGGRTGEARGAGEAGEGLWVPPALRLLFVQFSYARPADEALGGKL